MLANQYDKCNFCGEQFNSEDWSNNITQVDDHLYHKSCIIRQAHSFDANGIIYWLGTKKGTSKWINPALCSNVIVLSSTLMGDSERAQAITGVKTVRCVTRDEENSWFMIDLKNVNVIPTHYSLKHYSTWNTEALRNWRFEGSNNSTNGFDGHWHVLALHIKDTTLQSKGASATWILSSDHIDSASYSQFRILQDGKNSNNHNYLALSGFELYGIVTNHDKVIKFEPSTNGPLTETKSQEKYVQCLSCKVERLEKFKQKHAASMLELQQREKEIKQLHEKCYKREILITSLQQESIKIKQQNQALMQSQLQMTNSDTKAKTKQYAQKQRDDMQARNKMKREALNMKINEWKNKYLTQKKEMIKFQDEKKAMIEHQNDEFRKLHTANQKLQNQIDKSLIQKDGDKNKELKLRSDNTKLITELKLQNEILQNENTKLRKIKGNESHQNCYPVDQILEYKSKNKNDIAIRYDVIQKQSTIDNIFNVHVNRLKQWDNSVVNLQKEYEKLREWKNDDDEKNDNHAMPVNELLNSYTNCITSLKIQQSRVEDIVEHVASLSKCKKEAKNMLKKYKQNVKASQQQYDKLNVSYTNLKSQRTEWQETVSDIITKINEIVQKENEINKTKCEMLDNLNISTVEKEKYDKLLMKCKSLTAKYFKYEQHIDAEADEINAFFKQKWENHERIWPKWNVDDIVSWIKYMVYKNKIKLSKEVNLDEVRIEMKIQKFSGKLLPKIEKNDLKLFGIKVFDDYQQIYKHIQIIINKHPHIEIVDDHMVSGNVEGGILITQPKVQIPEKFKCPISGEIMIDPVVYDDVTYDRLNFLEYVQKHKTLPGSNEEHDEDEVLFKNRKLKQKIDAFLDANPQFKISYTE